MRSLIFGKQKIQLLCCLIRPFKSTNLNQITKDEIRAIYPLRLDLVKWSLGNKPQERCLAASHI